MYLSSPLAQQNNVPVIGPQKQQPVQGQQRHRRQKAFKSVRPQLRRRKRRVRVNRRVHADPIRRRAGHELAVVNVQAVDGLCCSPGNATAVTAKCRVKELNARVYGKETTRETDSTRQWKGDNSLMVGIKQRVLRV